jgi:hypothetical protein
MGDPEGLRVGDYIDLADKVQRLQSLLVTRATGGFPDVGEYVLLRKELLKNAVVGHLLPRFVATSRDLDQFWQFIKPKFAKYAERRQFLWDQFHSAVEAVTRTVQDGRTNTACPCDDRNQCVLNVNVSAMGTGVWACSGDTSPDTGSNTGMDTGQDAGASIETGVSQGAATDTGQDGGTGTGTHASITSGCSCDTGGNINICTGTGTDTATFGLFDAGCGMVYETMAKETELATDPGPLYICLSDLCGPPCGAWIYECYPATATTTSGSTGTGVGTSTATMTGTGTGTGTQF